MDTRSEDRDFLLFRDEASNEALARVFDVVAPRLLLLAAHLTPDAAQAEDLVQTTFLQGMRDAQRYDGVRPVAGWLAGILNHRALDLRRRSALREHEPLTERAIDTLDPAQLVADQDFTEHVITKIGAIDSPYREPLMLRVVHGLEPTAIAHTLGRAPGTVRMQLKRGLERLRDAMPKQSSFLSVFFLETGNGLEAVKATVLHKAGASAAIAATTTGVVGGFITMKLAVAAIVALVVSIALFTLTGSGPEERVSQSAAPRTPVSDVTARPSVSEAKPAEELRVADSATQRAAVETPSIEPLVSTTTSEFVVRVSFESDDSPAAGVGVYVRALGSGALGSDGRTNALGRVTYTNLAAGMHTLHVDRLEDSIRFDASLPGVLEVTIPAGIRVAGRVVDLVGKPVAGARILRLNGNHHDVLQIVAETNSDGRFELRDVAGGSEYLARRDGFQPSELQTVRGRPGDDDELELMLGARGHRVTGVVLDAQGEPVPHAWVALGADEDARDELRGSSAHPTTELRRKAMDLEALLLRADESGRFESREVPAGYVLAIARPVAPDSAEIGSTTLWLRFGDEAELTINLEAGAVVEGVVRDTDGHPVEGVVLEAEWEGTPLLGQMEDDIGPWMTDRRCVSTADGSYRLVGLLAGDYDLRIEGERAEQARGDREISAGERVRWDPVVESLTHLDVRLLNASGSPLEGWVVSLTDGSHSALGGGFWRDFGSPTDSDGRRRVPGLKRAGTYAVGVFAPNADGAFNRLPAAMRAGVTPTGGELVVQLTFAEGSFGSVSGRWLNDSGQPQRERRLSLQGANGRSSTSLRTDVDGHFLFEFIPTGSYRLTAGLGEVELAAFELGADEELRVGDLRSPASSD